MIISHKHRFIFFKTHKTAGTSVEIALSRYCGPDDIITPIGPKDEVIRAKLGVRPQNYLLPWKNHAPSELLAAIKRRRRFPEYRNHISAKEVKIRIPGDVWSSYFKFCFERNSWDKVASIYRYFQHVYPDPDDFLANCKIAQSDWPIYTIDDIPVVDYIGRYESLQGDLQEVCSRIGIEYDGWLPVTKKTTGSGSNRFLDVFSRDHVAEVATRYRQEIAYFGFRFSEESNKSVCDSRSRT